MNIEKPNRKKHVYLQHIHAAPEAVFPLLCPVMETKWVPGWMPATVLSDSGVIEPGCIFITPSKPQDAIWVVTTHDPVAWRLEMYKIAPEHSLTRLEIGLSGEQDGTTSATVAYEVTVLGAAGEKFVEEFTEEWYEDFMLSWEKALNHYLQTGRKIA
jgi:hypothetical protein